jgi:hypothetical protein
VGAAAPDVSPVSLAHSMLNHSALTYFAAGASGRATLALQLQPWTRGSALQGGSAALQGGSAAARQRAAGRLA